MLAHERLRRVVCLGLALVSACGLVVTQGVFSQSGSAGEDYGPARSSLFLYLEGPVLCN